MTVLAALGLLILTETGVPVPVPGDLLMLLVGEQASSGQINLAIAATAIEAVTIFGTVALFLAVRGPAKALVARLGPRVGLTEERMARFGAVIDRRGALTIGRMTPGARTITVVAAATSALPPRRVLPHLLLGSTLFVQAHVLLGYILGPAARAAIEKARGPMLIALAGLLVAGAALWLVRKGKRGALEAFSEASCPACLAVGALTKSFDAPVVADPIRG